MWKIKSIAANHKHKFISNIEKVQQEQSLKLTIHIGKGEHLHKESVTAC